MKSMKKISLIALVAIFSISFASAQVGLQAGYSISTNANNEISLNGFHAGPIYNLSIQGPVSLQYGLLYNYLTKKSEGTFMGITGTSTTTAHRLDIPFRVTASFPVSGNVSAFIFGGPNFNLGLMQKTDGTADFWGVGSGYIEGDNIYKSEMSDGSKRYSMFDLQLGAGAGLKFNNLGVKFSYDWGMLDRDNSDSGIWKNNDMKVGLFVNF